jgi:hypothetical protein
MQIPHEIIYYSGTVKLELYGTIIVWILQSKLPKINYTLSTFVLNILDNLSHLFWKQCKPNLRKNSIYVGYTYRLISCNYLQKNSWDVFTSSMWRWKHTSIKWNWEHVCFKTGSAKIGNGDFCCLNKCINIINADKILFLRSWNMEDF